MKHLRIIPILLLTASLATAQVPQGIKYQVVVRDNNGIPVENKSISLRISLLEDSLTGQAGYVETHSTSTNALGLVNISIGEGTPVQGSMIGLQWNRNDYFAKVEIDTAGGNSYVVLGTSQLLTVPYAFHSGSSDMIKLMSTADRDAIINPLPGLMILNSDSNVINIFNGKEWLGVDGKPVFQCGNILADIRDGRQYPTVSIGSQCWMAKNLNVGTFVNSSFTGSGHSDVSNNGIIEKYCYQNVPDSCDVYGGLYDWDEMMDYVETEGVQGICPAGWHIPADGEWISLVNYLDGFSVAGGRLKETGTTHWQSPNTGATNSSGFTALPSGFRESLGNFFYAGLTGYWWTSSTDLSYPWFHHMVNDYQGVYRANTFREYGYSLRCLRD